MPRSAPWGCRAYWIAPIRGKGQPGQFRKRPRTCPFHDLGAMIFNGALADMEIHGNILAGMTSENHFHDFVLPMGEARETPVRGFLKAKQLAD
jgi:hypothetical protein